MRTTLGIRAVEIIFVLFLALLCGKESLARAADATLAIDASSYQLIASTRVGRSTFDYTYRVKVVNTGPAASNVRATVNSTSTSTVIVAGDVNFGNVAADSSATSLNTFTLRQDRTVLFDPSQLRWAVTADGTSSPDIAKVVIDKTSAFLPGVGRTVQLQAQALDSSGAAVTGQKFEWTSSSGAIAVDATGLVAASAIGSAQIVAQVGSVKSLPTLVFAAEPVPGAVLVTDAQIISVGAFQNLGADGIPGVGTQYDVTLQGIAAPAPGTVLLALETQPVGGVVVATREDQSGVVATLAIASLPQMLKNYNINWTLDLSGYPVTAAAPDPPAGFSQLQSAHPATRSQAAEPLDGLTSVDDQLPAFKAFACDGAVKAQLTPPTLQLAIKNQLQLVIENSPGFTKRALIGSITLVPTAAFTLKAGFTAKGKCEAAGQIKLNILGLASLVITPAVRLGIGINFAGSVLLAQGQLGITGQVGVAQATIGYQCTETDTESQCEGLHSAEPINMLKPVANFKPGVQAQLSSQIYFLAGLDLAFFQGLGTADILRFRIGPTQTFDLASAQTQAEQEDYSSQYALTLDATLEPGKALKNAIDLLMADKDGALSFTLQASSSKISESPKGVHSVSATRVGLNSNGVDFHVNFDPKTIDYFLLGYNINSVQLYRRAEGEFIFSPWKTFPFTASNQSSFTLHWQPEFTDIGKADFAAFVEPSLIPLPLEISDNSIQSVEVACNFSGSQTTSGRSPARKLASPLDAAKPTDATTCADAWDLVASFDYETDNGGFIGKVNATFTRDPSYVADGSERYLGQGTGTVSIPIFENQGCTVSPKTFSLANDTLNGASLLVTYGPGPATYGDYGVAAVNFTISCPNDKPFALGPIQIAWLPGNTGFFDPSAPTIEFSSPPNSFLNDSFTFTRE